MKGDFCGVIILRHLLMTYYDIFKLIGIKCLAPCFVLCVYFLDLKSLRRPVQVHVLMPNLPA